LAFGDGFMIVTPYSRTQVAAPAPTHLSVKYHRVKVNIDNQVATTSIDQVFKNDFDQDLEGTYIFPLPEEASISDFALYMNGKRVSGEIVEKDKARQIYEDIVRRMKDPGLLEYAGRNMFKARVYPIPRHGEARIELVYHQALRSEAGVCRYVYPLNTEKFSPTPLAEVAISVRIFTQP
jgi:Ca-activated chloride channel family protein